MKKLIIAIAAVAMLAPVSMKAQDDKYGPNSAECLKYLSYYEEYYKQKNYKDATPNWREAYKYCPPESRQKMLVDGTALVRKLISANAKNPIYKQALIDTLMTLHDQRILYFPKNAVTARNNKGLDMSNYIKDDESYLYNGYSEIIEANGVETKANIFLFQLKSAIELYKVGSLNEEDVIESYNRNVDIIAQIEPKNDVDAEQLEKVRADLESLFVSSRVASCDKLIALFTPRFEANPNDAELAAKIVGFMLKTEDCTDNALIAKAAATLYGSNPTPSAAHMVFQINSQRGNTADAIKYLEEAIKLSEGQEKADYSYELATYCYKIGNNIKAVEAARTAINADSENSVTGKSYFLIGSIWGALKCSGNDIAVRAPFWVAVDNMNRAKNADASLAEEANKKIKEYSTYFPSTADAFMFDLQDGQTYNVSCNGFSATTTVRTQK